MLDSSFPRRDFLKKTGALALGTGAALVLPSWACAGSRVTAVAGLAEEIGYTQAPLPYAYNTLEPAIDALTMDIHYNKHAGAYAKNLADAVKAEGVDVNAMPLTKLMASVSKYSAKMRNNGGGHYNHEFFWRSLRAPQADNKPAGSFLNVLQENFGSWEAFQTQFADAGKNRFGSGWAWLVSGPDKKLKIGSTPNQDNPLMDLSELKSIPLLGLDVWEHAYYLKYQNRRADYINAWWSVVNWPVVEQRFQRG